MHVLRPFAFALSHACTHQVIAQPSILQLPLTYLVYMLITTRPLLPPTFVLSYTFSHLYLSFIHSFIHSSYLVRDVSGISSGNFGSHRSLDGLLLSPAHGSPIPTPYHQLSPQASGILQHSTIANNTAVTNTKNNTNTKTITTTKKAIQPWKPTILVVDDSGTNRKMLVRSLNSTGLFTCREAEDGVEGQ